MPENGNNSRRQTDQSFHLTLPPKAIAATLAALVALLGGTNVATFFGSTANDVDKATLSASIASLEKGLEDDLDEIQEDISEIKERITRIETVKQDLEAHERVEGHSSLVRDVTKNTSDISNHIQMAH